MYLFYIDDSHERHFFTFCAIGIPQSSWKEAFNAIRAYRAHLRSEYGIFLWKELHAWKFVSGRGQPADRILNKTTRCQIYRESLAFLASLKELGLVVFGTTSRDEYFAYERLLNRINRTMKSFDEHALLYCDEGNQVGFTKLARRMAVFNYIPSRFGTWDDGKPSKNIPTERIIEDPVFKASHNSNLIQFADFCAYALLRKERPVASKTAYGLDRCYEILKPICFKDANKNDPLGIVRDNK